MTEKNWKDQALDEKISIGKGLPSGKTILMFDEVARYERVESEFDGTPTLRFLLKFKGEKDEVYIPKTVFKKIQAAINKKAIGLEIIKDGKGLDTTYATIQLFPPTKDIDVEKG